MKFLLIFQLRDKILEAAAKHDELETCQKIYRPISLKTVLSKEFIVKDDELKLNLYRTKQLFFEKPDPNEKLKYELIGEPKKIYNKF